MTKNTYLYVVAFIDKIVTRKRIFKGSYILKPVKVVKRLDFSKIMETCRSTGSQCFVSLDQCIKCYVLSDFL